VGHSPPEWLGILSISWLWRQAPWVLAGEGIDQGTIDLWLDRVGTVLEMQERARKDGWKNARIVLGGLF
jgi:hypothetical protein